VVLLHPLAGAGRVLWATKIELQHRVTASLQEPTSAC